MHKRMKLHLKLLNWSLSLFFFKTQWVYGVSSKIPNSPSHYLLFDLDTLNIDRFIVWLIRKHLNVFPHFIYRTPRGWHCIVFEPCSFRKCMAIISQAPCVDLIWFSIGLKRGYWFLHNWVPIPETWRMSYMKIERPVPRRKIEVI